MYIADYKITRKFSRYLTEIFGTCEGARLKSILRDEVDLFMSSKLPNVSNITSIGYGDEAIQRLEKHGLIAKKRVRCDERGRALIKTPLTACEKLLGFMQEKPQAEWYNSDFQKSPYFIGYEAMARMSDLQNLGMVECVRKDGRFKVWRITQKGMETTRIKKSL